MSDETWHETHRETLNRMIQTAHYRFVPDEIAAITAALARLAALEAELQQARAKALEDVIASMSESMFIRSGMWGEFQRVVRALRSAPDPGGST